MVNREFSLPLSVEDIQEIIPHRYPFLMIDRVTEFVSRERIVGFKNVTNNEPFFQGHFPGRPIMPGVLVLEAIAQLGCIFATLSENGKEEGKILVFSGAEKVKFRRQIVPGDIVRFEISRFRHRRGHWKVEGEATVDGDLAAEALITAAEV